MIDAALPRTSDDDQSIHAFCRLPLRHITLTGRSRRYRAGSAGRRFLGSSAFLYPYFSSASTFDTADKMRARQTITNARVSPHAIHANTAITISLRHFMALTQPSRNFSISIRRRDTGNFSVILTFDAQMP